MKGGKKTPNFKMEILPLLPKAIWGYKTEGKLLLKRVGYDLKNYRQIKNVKSAGHLAQEMDEDVQDRKILKTKSILIQASKIKLRLR